MKIIAYVNEAGNVSLMTPAEEARRMIPVTPYRFQQSEDDPSVYVPVTRAETDDEFIAWVGAKDVPEGVAYKVADRPEPMSDEDLVTWFAELPASAAEGKGHELWQTEEVARLASEAAALNAAFEEIRPSLEAGEPEPSDD